MKLGISSYAWSWSVGVEGYMPDNPLGTTELLNKVNELDLHLLQIADNPSLHQMSIEELKNIKTIASTYNIALEIGTRGVDPKHLRKYLEIARMFNSEIVRTITPGLDIDASNMIKQVLPEYEESGVSLVLENHDEYPTYELAEFIKNIGSKYLGACLDTVNNYSTLETTEEVVKILAPYTLNLHVKDYDIVRVDYQAGLLIEGRPAGEGRLDVKWVIEQLKKAGRSPNAILELWTPFAGTVEKSIQKETEWVVKSVNYLKSIIK